MLLLQIQKMNNKKYGYFRSILVTFLLSCTVCGYAGTATAANSKEPLYTVLNPTGFPPPIQRHPLAPRTPLAGRPIYLVDVHFDNGDVFLKEMQKWFAKNMPQVKTVFREKKGDYFTNDPKLWAEIKAKHGLMIMAIGH